MIESVLPTKRPCPGPMSSAANVTIPISPIKTKTSPCARVSRHVPQLIRANTALATPHTKRTMTPHAIPNGTACVILAKLPAVERLLGAEFSPRDRSEERREGNVELFRTDLHVDRNKSPRLRDSHATSRRKIRARHVHTSQAMPATRFAAIRAQQIGLR